MLCSLYVVLVCLNPLILMMKRNQRIPAIDGGKPVEVWRENCNSNTESRPYHPSIRDMRFPCFFCSYCESIDYDMI